MLIAQYGRLTVLIVRLLRQSEQLMYLLISDDSSIASTAICQPRGFYTSSLLSRAGLHCTQMVRGRCRLGAHCKSSTILLPVTSHLSRETSGLRQARNIIRGDTVAGMSRGNMASNVMSRIQLQRPSKRHVFPPITGAVDYLLPAVPCSYFNFH